MIGELLEAAKALLSARNTLQKLGEERRSKLASYLDSIAKVLLTIVERKEHGKKSVDVCAELDIYVDKLIEVGSPTFSIEELDRLVLELKNAQHSRAMLYITEEPEADYYDGYVDQLNEVAGLFIGLANTLRAK